MSKPFPLIDVEIDHGRDVLTVAVPEHEVRVLQAVHGPDKVRQAAVQEGDTLDLDDSADAEVARLTRKYQRINAPDPVRLAYPLGAQALAAFGFDLHRGATEAAPAAMVVKHKKPAPAPDAAAGKGKKAE